MKIKILTCIYSNLHMTKLGGRSNRDMHYRMSLLSLLKMSNADFICYTSEQEIKNLETFFYNQNNINKNKLKLVVYDLEDHYFLELFKKHKDYDFCLNRGSDHCLEIQYMKFMWFKNENLSYDYYFWFDAGLSHCGLIPNKYLITGVGEIPCYSTNLFNNYFLNNLIKNSDEKFTIIGKENQKNHWSGTVNSEHFNKYNSSTHIVGGLFGGSVKLWIQIVNLFEIYVNKVTNSDNRLYHEEDIMTLMFRNHSELFKCYEFDAWWHENVKVSGIDMNEYLKDKKSFYNIIEEFNNYNIKKLI